MNLCMLKKIGLLFLISLFFACHQPRTEIDFSNLSNVDEAIAVAAESKRYLALIIEDKHCDLCGLYKQNIMAELKSSTANFGDEVLIKTVDASKPENRWMNQLVREYAFPLTFVLDPHGDIKGFFRGANVPRLKEALAHVSSGEKYYRSSSPFMNLGKKDTLLPALGDDAKKIDFVNTLYHIYSDYKSGAVSEATLYRRLQENIGVQPFFLNNYLLTKVSGVHRAEETKILSLEILNGYTEPLDDVLYENLKAELLFVADIPKIGANTPVLTTDNEVINLGELPVNRMKEVRIPIKNAGASNLLISQVKVSCSCLLLDWSKKNLPPGATGYIKVQYHPTNVGQFNQQVLISSNAADLPFQITIKGNVTNIK